MTAESLDAAGIIAAINAGLGVAAEIGDHRERRDNGHEHAELRQAVALLTGLDAGEALDAEDEQERGEQVEVCHVYFLFRLNEPSMRSVTM